MAIKNEKDGRFKLEQRVESIEKKSKDIKKMAEDINNLETNAMRLRNKVIKVTNELKRNKKERNNDRAREPPEISESTKSGCQGNDKPGASVIAKDTSSLSSIYDGILEALFYELYRKFEGYDAKLVQYDEILKVREAVQRQADPPPQAADNSRSNDCKKVSIGESDTFLQELHHQVLAAQANAYRIDTLDKRVSELREDPSMRGTMILDMERTLIMWDIPFELRKLTSVGDSCDRVNLQNLIANLLERINATEYSLVQLCEHNSRLECLEKELPEHVSDLQKHSRALVVHTPSSLRAASKSPGQDDNSSSEMSLGSDTGPQQNMSGILQEFHKASKMHNDLTKDALTNMRQDVNLALQQASQNFCQQLKDLWRTNIVTTANLSASGHQLALLQTSVGNMQHEQDKQQFDLQFSKNDCESEVKLLNHKVDVVLQQYHKSNQREQELGKKVALCEQFISESANQWHRICTAIATKLHLIELSLHKRLDGQLRLMRDQHDQEMKNFYNNFGCRGMVAEGFEAPQSKRFKALRPQPQPMLLDDSVSDEKNDVVVFDSPVELPAVGTSVSAADSPDFSVLTSAELSKLTPTQQSNPDQNALFSPGFLELLQLEPASPNCAVHLEVDSAL